LDKQPNLFSVWGKCGQNSVAVQKRSHAAAELWSVEVAEILTAASLSTHKRFDDFTLDAPHSPIGQR
jgi:hypothetical protein